MQGHARDGHQEAFLELALGVQGFSDALAIAISSSMRARCALPGQTVSLGITAARVGHHSNCPCLPNDVPTKSTQPTEGSKVHPPGTTFTITGHFEHLIAMAAICLSQIDSLRIGLTGPVGRHLGR
jgi:hypothetical protein